jgi:hypothetical protein
MDKTLAEQVQDVLEALAMAGAQAAIVKKTVRELHISFGLKFNHMDDGIAQIVKRLEHVKRLAERLG